MQRDLISASSISIFCLSLLLAGSVIAADQRRPDWQAPNWDRDLAEFSAHQVESVPESQRLFNLATQADSSETLDALSQLAERTDWPLPAREAVLLRFTNQLRQLPPFSIEPSVIEHLQQYRSKVLVAHDESRELGVPLYPVRAAAFGLIHHWTRQQSAQQATYLIAADPKQLLDRYLASQDRNFRAGIEAVLVNAANKQLQELLDYGLPRLTDQTDLTGLLGKAAVYLGSSELVSNVLHHGRGPSITEITRLASRHFSATDIGDILVAGIEAAEASTAAIMIAELTPGSIDQQQVSTLLMHTVGSAELGSVAALALVQWGSAGQTEQLQALAAADPSSLVAKRVQIALSFERPARRGDSQ